jgi:hypothetical protein
MRRRYPKLPSRSWERKWQVTNPLESTCFMDFSNIPFTVAGLRELYRRGQASPVEDSSNKGRI